MNTTVVYYTCNAENAVFEERAVRALVDAAGDTPIISVSQKPMKLGNNICVGDVGRSSQNHYVQLLIGLETATTKWICAAEADSLYVPEYFQFQPPRDDTFYLAKPLWVFFKQRGYAKQFANKPNGSELAMVCSRRLLIERIRTILEPIGGSWGPHGTGEACWPYLIDKSAIKLERFYLDNPCITVKTDNQMHPRTPHRPGTRTRKIPYWGTSDQFLDRFFR
jgi:hypothetical protein